jgi:hypothetical protein
MKGDCFQGELSPDDPGYIPPSHESARQTYLRSLLARLPEPADIIWSLPLAVVEALSGAYRSKSHENCGAWRVPTHLTADAFRYGMCDRDGFLTTYGADVRRELREMEQ